MLGRLIFALLIAATPTLGLAQQRGTSRFDAVVVDGTLTAATVTTPSLKLGSFTLSGVGTTAGTLAAGNDSRIVGAVQTSALSSAFDTAFGSTRGSILYRGAAGWSLLGPSTAGYVFQTNGAGADPSWVALSGGVSSAALDSAFGSTQGSILYRSASAWTTLTPGTAGYVLQTGGTGANPSWAAQSGGGGSSVGSPQGRLTLTSGTPVLSATVSAATSVLYTPYVGNLVPLWNGSAFVMTAFTETTQALSDTTKSPSAAAAGQVYDYFAWSDGGTVRLSRGPTWSAGTGGSNTVRGTGTGGTALTRVNGILVNAAAITNGPAAGYGTYVGTIATDAGGATVTFNPTTAAAPAVGATVGLWNAYNRVPVTGQVRDTTASWTYSGSAWRAANGANPRITFVTGLAEDAWVIDNITQTGGPAAGNAYGGVGLDSVTGAGGPTGTAGSAGGNASVTYLSAPSKAIFNAPLGSHFASAIESVSGGSAATFYGASGNLVSGLTWQGRY